MSNTEKARKRVRKNYQSQIQDLILYCKVSIEVMETSVGEVMETMTEVERGKAAAFRAVLKRLGVEP